MNARRLLLLALVRINVRMRAGERANVYVTLLTSFGEGRVYKYPSAVVTSASYSSRPSVYSQNFEFTNSMKFKLNYSSLNDMLCHRMLLSRHLLNW